MALKRVAYIEDDTDAARLVERLLSFDGIELDTFPNVHQFISREDQKPYKVIIMDMSEVMLAHTNNAEKLVDLLQLLKESNSVVSFVSGGKDHPPFENLATELGILLEEKPERRGWTIHVKRLLEEQSLLESPHATSGSGPEGEPI